MNYLIYLFLLVVFILDLLITPAIAVWLIYFFPLLVVSWKQESKFHVYFFTFLCSILSLLGSFSTWPFTIEMEEAILNRFIFSIVLWITMLIVRRARKAEIEIYDKSIMLQKLNSDLIMVEQKERMHFSAVLHDTVAQTLAALKLRLYALEENISTDNKDNFEEAQKLVTESIKQTRSIMAELSPQILDLGLLPAIEWLIDQMQMKYGLSIVLKENNSDPETLAVDLRITLYETIKEILLNVVKHAKASHASVELAGSDEEFKIFIKDNGIGFDQNKISQNEFGGFGLFSVRERLRLFNWELKINSGYSKGTEIIVEKAKIQKAPAFRDLLKLHYLFQMVRLRNVINRCFAPCRCVTNPVFIHSQLKVNRPEPLLILQTMSCQIDPCLDYRFTYLSKFVGF